MQRARDEWRQRVPPRIPLLDAFDAERLLLDIIDVFVRLGFGGDIHELIGGPLVVNLREVFLRRHVQFFAADLYELRIKRTAVLGDKFPDDRPVFGGDKRLDLLLAFADQAQGHGLDAARGEPVKNCLPDKRAHLIADDPVHHPAGPLARDEILVDSLRLLHRLRNSFFRDLVKENPVDVLFLIGNLLGDIGCNRLAFAVRVGRKVHAGRLGGRVAQFPDRLLLAGYRFKCRCESVFNIDAEVALRQVLNMTHRCLHDIILAEVSVDRLGLRRRFHDYQ